MQYTPNLNDPRVIKRIESALGFARGVLSTTKSHQWSTRFIDKHMGQQQRPLGKWLREQLLITTEQKYNSETGLCKEHMLNADGYSRLKASLYQPKNLIPTNPTNSPSVSEVQDITLVKSWIAQLHDSELKQQEFHYMDKSGRLWHPIQNIRREFKNQILTDAGLIHQYDIQCCAPTLLIQYAQQCGMDEWLPAMQRYLKERNVVRQELAIAAEISEDKVKVIINALICGAYLSKADNTAIYNELGGDLCRIEYLQQDAYILQLKQDIKTMWSYIKPTQTRRFVKTKKGTYKMAPFSCRDKWSVYFRLERQILNSVSQFMRENQVKFFLEHDGWSSSKELNELELTQWVRESTGYMIKLSKT